MTEINDTSARILQKADELFMQYGLRSVSMDDIANGLGISKKTIYQYYADKDELVNGVISATLKDNQQKCNIDKAASVDAIHEIFLAIDMVNEIFRGINPSLLFDMQKYYPAAFRMYNDHKNDYLYTLIRENLQRGKAEELYRQEIDIETISRFRIESIIIPFYPEFHTRVRLSLAEIEEELTMHFLFGLVSQKGYKLTLKYKEERNKKLQSDAKK